MRILAIDTSGKELGIGVFDNKKCLFERYLKADRAYNRHIMPMIDEAISGSGIKLRELDIFAAALGPGSFTGIRVGMAVMKALAHALGRQFCGVSTLDIMAAAAQAKGRKWAVLEAGRGEVFAAEYSKSGVRSPESGVKNKYMLLTREKFFKKIKSGDAVTGITGENIMVELKEKNGKILLIEQAHVDMRSFAVLVESGGKRDRKGIYETAPVYIRPSEAEARRKIKAKTEGK